ncbi:hypothetical protein Asp14428_41620 [Actinoplanes sp. NBRC 14428]|nr:hypothetical protein Asp14428_41620 [Actinoplanes sp. NBRC 14428]
MRSLIQADLERRVASLTNEERRKAGLRRLTPQPLLGQAARAHSTDMAARYYFSHVSLEGATVADRVALTGYAYAIVGENIAWGQENALQAVNAWMRSPGHKANILSPDYTEIGVGVAEYRGALVWTQNFASPFS